MASSKVSSPIIQMPNPKHQITNKFQKPISNDPNRIEISKRLCTRLRSPWKLCHNSPNPSFRTSPPKADEIRNPVKIQYNHSLSGSRLASRFAGLGRDDESQHSLLRGEWACVYHAELNKQSSLNFGHCDLEFPSTSASRFRKRGRVKSAIRNPLCSLHAAYFPL